MNGFGIHSWRDVSAIVTVAVLSGGAVLGIIMWGLKLDTRTEQLQIEQTRIQMQLKEIREQMRD